ncbi:pentapeptide repeat-containing protein [Pseudooceanicola spongiae]|uniref:Pentapeptide repeat-containing protein n=1 Tax=Pseudooceanicola spongiae TaxID=2613965 RepID=A0A7L9WND8_9RHOB|nr:pentapeptide repeat-containing protein [Pseudooceanicola spongiae]QOL81334.1 hypothetical protein F3W81_11220 [Pseudooceanicola spongiae]
MQDGLTDIAPAELVAALSAPFHPGEALDLTGRRVTGPVDLSGRDLCGFDMTGSRFEGAVTAKDTVFRGLTWFRDCQFAGAFTAVGALFGHDARFDGSVFAAELDLSRAEARGTMVLDRVQANAPVWMDRMQILSSLSLAGADFAATVSLEETEAYGGLWADRAQFGARVTARGMEVHGRTWLKGVQMAPPAPNAAPAASLARQIRSYGYVWG